jgi:hypothetical protein
LRILDNFFFFEWRKSSKSWIANWKSF